MRLLLFNLLFSIYDMKRTFTPWIIFARHFDTLQDMCFLAFGTCAENAILHFKSAYPNFDVLDCYLQTNPRFVCNADFCNVDHHFINH